MMGPLRKTGLIVAEVDDQAMLYSAEQGIVHVLNATSKVIWELCDGGHSPADMAQALRERFVVGPECDLLHDVLAALDLFAAKGLLEAAA
jgi:hypothetical protein